MGYIHKHNQAVENGSAAVVVSGNFRWLHKMRIKGLMD